MIKGIGHVAFRVKDLNTSVEFYTRVLCGKAVFSSTENGEVNMVYVKLANGALVELFKSEPDAKRSESDIGFMHLSLTIDDVYEEEKRIAATGWPTKPVRVGKYGNMQLWLSDPDGNPIELMQLLPNYLDGKAW